MMKFDRSRIAQLGLFLLVGICLLCWAVDTSDASWLRSVSAAPASIELEFVNLNPVRHLSLNVSTFDSALLEDVNMIWENTTRHLSESVSNRSRNSTRPSEGICINRLLQEAAESIVSSIESFCTPVEVQDGNCSAIIQGTAVRSLFSLGWTSPDVEIISEASQLPFYLDSLNSTGTDTGGASEYDLLIGLAKLVAERIKPNIQRAATTFQSAALAGIGSVLQNESTNATTSNLYIILLFGTESSQHCASG
jgi:hypothetical protein